MPKNPFRYFNTSPEIIRLAVMMYVRFPLSLRSVEDLLPERGIDICYESVRPPTITSTINAISNTETASKTCEMSPLSSGANFLLPNIPHLKENADGFGLD